jgi:hypothetical protein
MRGHRPWHALLLAQALILTLAGSSAGQARTEAQSALMQLAGQIARVTTSAPVFVAVTPLLGEIAAGPERAALEAKLVRVLGSAVPAARSRGDTTLSKSAASSRSRELGLNLLLLTPRLAGGQLVVEVDVIEWELSFWARTRKPRGTVVSHASVSAPADAEIRRYLPRPKGLLTEEFRFSTPTSDAIGLGCGDVSGEGNVEMLVVGRRQLFLGRLALAGGSGRGSFSIRKTADWAKHSPLSPHPLRAPLAGAWLEAGHVLVGSSDRADLVLYDQQLETSKFGEPALPVAANRCHAFTATGLAQETKACGPFGSQHHQVKTAAAQTPSHDAIAVLTHTNVRGIVISYELVSSGSELTLTIDSPLEERRVHTLPDHGAQLALADLDGDGVVEAITTAAADATGADSVRVYSVLERGPVLVATREVPSVRALSVCPFEGRNPLRLAVLLADEIRILE